MSAETSVNMLETPFVLLPSVAGAPYLLTPGAGSTVDCACIGMQYLHTERNTHTHTHTHAHTQT